MNPATDPYLIGNVNVPLVQQNGGGPAERRLVLGRPLYEAMPRRMVRRPRYYDEEDLRYRCEEYVANRGGPTFFEQRGWRGELHVLGRRFRRDHGERGSCESPEVCESGIVRDLAESRALIEQRLGNRVRHLCYPWYHGSSASVMAARKVGYRTNFWGVLPGSNEARPGCDLFHIPRLDCRYLPRLPGPRRLPLSRIVWENFRCAGQALVQNSGGPGQLGLTASSPVGEYGLPLHQCASAG